jgi:hypothetical protein
LSTRPPISTALCLWHLHEEEPTHVCVAHLTPWLRLQYVQLSVSAPWGDVDAESVPRRSVEVSTHWMPAVHQLKLFETYRVRLSIDWAGLSALTQLVLWETDLWVNAPRDAHLSQVVKLQCWEGSTDLRQRPEWLSFIERRLPHLRELTLHLWDLPSWLARWLPRLTRLEKLTLSAEVVPNIHAWPPSLTHLCIYPWRDRPAGWEACLPRHVQVAPH